MTGERRNENTQVIMKSLSSIESAIELTMTLAETSDGVELQQTQEEEGLD